MCARVCLYYIFLLRGIKMAQLNLDIKHIAEIIDREPPNIFIASVPLFVLSRLTSTHARITQALSKLCDTHQHMRELILLIDPQYYICPRAQSNVANMMLSDADNAQIDRINSFIERANAVEPKHMVAYVDNSLPRAIMECADYCIIMVAQSEEFIHIIEDIIRAPSAHDSSAVNYAHKI
jgi:hypothetical protein